MVKAYTAIPYRASTGPEQGSQEMETGFSLLGKVHRENPVLALYGIAVYALTNFDLKKYA